MGRKLVPSRDLLVLAATFALLLLVAILVPAQEEQKPSGLPSLSSHSSDDNGGSILYRWLGQLGYRVARLERRTFQVDAHTSALLILSPTDGFDRAQGDEVERFVRSGGLVLYAGTREPPAPASGVATPSLLSRFGVRYEQSSTIRNAVPALAVLMSPPAATTVVDTRASIGSDTYDAVPLLNAEGSAGRIVLAKLHVGAGRLIVLSSSHLLSNAGLPQADNWRVVLNLLPEPGAGTLLFDEYHHGLVGDESLQSVMWQRPWGWAAVGALILALGFIAARGKRFGRAVLVSRDGRRAPAEYVYSMSTLLRRGRHQDWVRAHYASRLKEAVRHHLGAGDDVGQRLARETVVADDLPAQDVIAVLEELESSGHLKEDELVALVGTVEGMRVQLEGRRNQP